MGILQYVEQTEGISLLMSRIEEDNLIPRGIIVFLVPGEKHVGTQVREHLADAVDEHVRLVVAVVQSHVGFNLIAHKADEVVGVRLRSQFRGHHVGMEPVALERGLPATTCRRTSHSGDTRRTRGTNPTPGR